MVSNKIDAVSSYTQNNTSTMINLIGERRLKPTDG